MSNILKIDINKACRTCMWPSGDMKPLFGAFNTKECSVNDGLPAQMCHKCVNQITNFNNFLLKCLETDKLLRNNTKTTINAQTMTDFEVLLKNANQENIIKNITSNNSNTTSEKNNPTPNDPLEIIKIDDLRAIKTETDFEVKSLNLIKNENQENSNNSNTTSETNELTPNGPLEMNFKIGDVRTLETENDFEVKPLNITSNILFEREIQSAKAYTCLVCNTSCNCKSSLLRHSHKHTGKRPYECSDCDCTFVRRDVFVLHKLRVHSALDTKSFECSLCGKTYKRNYSLIKHKSAHIGGVLKSHLRTYKRT